MIFFIGIGGFGIGIYCLNKAHNIRISKAEEEEIERQKLLNIQNEISSLSSKKIKLIEEIEKEKQKADKIYEKEKKRISEQLEIYKKNTDYASEQYAYCLEKEYQKIEKEYDNKLKQIEQDKKDADSALQKLRDSLNAGVQAQLREKEKEESINFYKLNISESDLEDILSLNKLKITFHQPVVLSKLIWSTYFQKQTTEMCNRILGTTKKCGIYKITNLQSKQCYIGQSVDIATRWKDHIKCGLGIDASATNKLYKAMQKDGIWNFSFELMEECPRTQLNEKERFWIELYQSDKFGYNLTKGNK